MGIASLILGIIGFLIGITIFKDLALILCVLSVVLGIIAIVKKKNRVIAIIAVVIAVVGFVVVFAMDDDKKAEEKQPTEVVEVTNDNGEVVATEAAKETKAAKAEYEVGEGTVAVWTDSIGTKWVKVAVPVKNTGSTNLYLSTGSVEIENSSGSLEDTIEMVSVYPQVLKPGETAYYYEESFYEGNSSSGLKAVPHVEVEKSTVDCIRYEISEPQIKNKEYSGAVVMGRVENKTSEEGTSVYVVAQLFDANKKLVGVQTTILDNGLKAGEKKAFETSSLSSEINVSDVSTYAIYAFPYQYQF